MFSHIQGNGREKSGWWAGNFYRAGMFDYPGKAGALSNYEQITNQLER